MPIFVIAILAPTLLFYVYALAQFWAEFRRRRHPEMGTIELRDASPESEELEFFPESELPRPAASVAIGAGPVQPAVVPTYLKSRLAGFVEGTGRLAVKRGAKG